MHPPVPFASLYSNRGESLKILSRYEYCTQVSIVTRAKSKRKTTREGRTPSASFEFGNGFVLQSSHVQKLRQKICTLKLYQSPPPYPGEKPHKDASEALKKRWRKRADKYGAYFLILFRPETELYEKNQKHVYKYTGTQSGKVYRQHEKTYNAGIHARLENQLKGSFHVVRVPSA